MIDACRCLEPIDLGSREGLYWALRADLTSRQEELEIFDAAFQFFWVQSQTPEQPERRANETCTGEEIELEVPPTLDQNTSVEDFATNDSEDQGPRFMDFLPYSPNEALTKKDIGSLTDDEVRSMRRLIVQLAVKISTVVSRPTRLDPPGDVIDPSRMWRRNTRYGGDLVELPREKRRVQKTKVVLLCEVSGSMDSYSQFLIQFLFAMQNEQRTIVPSVKGCRPRSRVLTISCPHTTSPALSTWCTCFALS
ncbi:MAG: VWA domain-containing protein [Chloroflexota bacterium]|nr:MAG: VWA domain-containing protein [Chloroflexota bacterium]